MSETTTKVSGFQLSVERKVGNYFGFGLGSGLGFGLRLAE